MEVLNFKEIIDQFLIKKKFKKKSGEYYISSEEIESVFSLQKSSFSKSYYINIGYSFKQITELTNIKYKDSHIKIRFSHLTKNKEITLFDLEKISDVEFQSILELNIDRYLSYLNLEKFLEFIKVNRALLNLTSVEVRNFLISLDRDFNERT